jgi:hypothetical protein
MRAVGNFCNQIGENRQMLSIEGQTLGEVFLDLVTHEATDDVEQSAARHVARWLTAWEAAEYASAKACQEGDKSAWDAASEEQATLRRSMPFSGSGPWAESPSEWRTFVVGSVKFRVYPYTTGATMNVGISRIGREHAHAV